MNEIVIILIVVIVLLLTLTLLLIYISKRVNKLVKKIFVDRLQEFDFLLEDKEKKVNELNDEISKKKEQVEKMSDENLKTTNQELLNNSNSVVLPTYADLEDENIISIYKKIKYSFNFDVETAIQKLVKNNHENNSINLYKMYKKIRSYFTFEVLYNISTFQSEQQYVIVKELLSDEEKAYLKGVLHKKHFNINKFVADLDNLIIRSDPKIKVLVGDRNKSYNNIDESVETIYSDKITEGFKIEYKGVVFDYSI